MLVSRPIVVNCYLYMWLQAFGGGYYRGGFDPKMTKREAALVLGVRYVNTLPTTSNPFHYLLPLIFILITHNNSLMYHCFSAPQQTGIRSEKPIGN